MKKIPVVAIIFAFTLLNMAHAKDRMGDLGVGIVIGDATGPTLKYFTGNKTAIDVGLGFSSDFKVYADFLWHNWDLFPRPEKGLFGAYLGVGPRYEERDNDRSKKREDRGDQFGVRTIAGMNYWTEGIPLEIFLEAGPWFIFTPDTDTEIDFGVGARYYFDGGPKRTR